MKHNQKKKKTEKRKRERETITGYFEDVQGGRNETALTEKRFLKLDSFFFHATNAPLSWHEKRVVRV